MKRTFTALLVLAIAVWTWAALRVLKPFMGETPHNQESVALSSQIAMAGLGFTHLDIPAFRDPFQSFLYAEKPAVPKPISTLNKTRMQAPEEAPHIKVNGIMLEDSPMAILEQDGKTEFARPGQEVFGFQVRSVQAGKVVLRKQGKVYTLNYP